MVGREIERGEIVRYKEREREKGLQERNAVVYTDWNTMTQAN